MKKTWTLKRVARESYRLTIGGVEFEITREAFGKREWYVARWGASEIEGYWPSLESAISHCKEIA